MPNNAPSLSTRDRVFTICDELSKQNRKPSVRLVLSMLPDITSTSSVHKPFKEWMDKQSALQKSLYEKLGLSEGFAQAFLGEISRYGAEAEERYKAQLTDAQAQRDAALEDIASTEARYNEQSAVVEQQGTEVQALKTELAEQQRAHAATVSELRQQLDDAHSAKDALSHTNEGLRTELAKIQVQLNSNATLVQEVKDNALAAQTDNRALRESQATLNKELARLEAALEGREQLTDELKSGAARYDALLTELKAEKSTLKEELASLRHQADNTKQQLADTLAKTAEQLQTIADLRATAAEQSRIIDRLTPAKKAEVKS